MASNARSGTFFEDQMSDSKFVTLQEAVFRLPTANPRDFHMQLRQPRGLHLLFLRPSRRSLLFTMSDRSKLSTKPRDVRLLRQGGFLNRYWMPYMTCTTPASSRPCNLGRMLPYCVPPSKSYHANRPDVSDGEKGISTAEDPTPRARIPQWIYLHSFIPCNASSRQGILEVMPKIACNFKLIKEFDIVIG